MEYRDQFEYYDVFGSNACGLYAIASDGNLAAEIAIYAGDDYNPLSGIQPLKLTKATALAYGLAQVEDYEKGFIEQIFDALTHGYLVVDIRAVFNEETYQYIPT